jgi:hypothetical protein
MFLYTPVFLLIFHSLLYDLRMSATFSWRGHLNGGCRRGRRPVFVSYGDRRYIVLQRTGRLSIRVPNARQPHHLVHHQELCLPPKAGSLKGKRKPGV